jgi:hypothetical protein
VVLALTGGFLAVAGAMLLAIGNGVNASETTITEAFGYIALALAGLLLLRLVAAVVRDGYE